MVAIAFNIQRMHSHIWNANTTANCYYRSDQSVFVAVHSRACVFCAVADAAATVFNCRKLCARKNKNQINERKIKLIQNSKMAFNCHHRPHRRMAKCMMMMIIIIMLAAVVAAFNWHFFFCSAPVSLWSRMAADTSRPTRINVWKFSVHSIFVAPV